MKNRFFAAVLVICMVLPCLTTGTWASGTASTGVMPIQISTTVDGVEINAQLIGDDLYLFLPNTADLTNLVLTFRKMDDNFVVSETVNVPSLLDKDGQERYSLKKVMRGVTVRFYIMQGSAIPTMYLTSGNTAQNRMWVDKSKKNETTGTMKMVAVDGTAIYDSGLSQIKARGNSTFYYYPKKPYQIKLSEKTDLLGTGEKVKTWVLLANYGDATLMHDKLFKDLAAQLGMPYTVSCNWVNLYYDGEYRGVYLLSEKNSVGSVGVDITDMEEAYEEANPTYGDNMVIAEGTNAYGQKYLYTENLTELENVTGGWLIELILQKVDEANGFYTANGNGVNLRSPEFAGQEAVEYISEYFQSFENAVYAIDEAGNYTGLNPETGKFFAEYVDMTSLVQAFLLQELARNPDGFRSSMYFHKDVDGILYAGPIWDQDMTLGTAWGSYNAPDIFNYHYLEDALVKIPEFYDAMVEYLYDSFLPLAEKWVGDDGVISQNAKLLSGSAAMNYILWPYVRVGDPSSESHLWAEGTNYETVTNDVQNWVETRLNVLKKTFVQPEEPEKDELADINGHWVEKDVRYVVEKGVFTGTDKGFEPELLMNRAMLVTTLYRLEGSPTGGTHSFTDVPTDSWYNDAVAWAAHNGIVTGYGNGLFGAADLVTREQFATILWRYAKMKGIDVSVGEDTNILSYTDAFEISEYAFEPLQWTCGAGIMSGMAQGVLAPQGNATRAHAATIFARFMVQME